jgi:type I restriction enzyme M protein
MGVVLPESVFDTTENKYIRLFIYKYFTVKAVVSLPQLTFEPFTSTKTSLLFAQKKTPEQVKEWDRIRKIYSEERGKLATRASNLVDVYINNKDRSKPPSIKDMKGDEEKELLIRFLKDYIEEDDTTLTSIELVTKYQDEITDLAKRDKDTAEVFGFVNTRWVF